MPDVNLNMVAGLPYARRIRVSNGARVWPARNQFEVRSEIRSGPSSTSPLRGTLTQFITAYIEDADIVLDLSLTGADTRAIKAGYYDIVLSDLGVTDARGIRALAGSIKLGPLITAAANA